MPSRVQELHNIMPIQNVPSVIQYGILSHERAARLPHASVALDVIQDRRSNKSVPGGLKLHQYANLYFSARNPMMYRRKEDAENLCVLRIAKTALNIDGVVISDCNASSDYVRFFRSPDGLRHLNYDLIYATYWNDPDYFEYCRKKSIKCAEVLVPNLVPVSYIIGAYVLSNTSAESLRRQGFNQQIIQNRHIFFG